MIATLLGGIGLFLLGMILMTEGLKSLAGESLRRVLARFTGGSVSSLLTGAGITALVQSSSATTLTTIGFVSAGLLSFPQAVGVIFGANVGTTSTSWIVSLLGLKLNISVAALPLIGLGALVHLLGRGRLPALGTALSGFGLIFVGIDTLQSGMQALSGIVDPGSLPRETIGGRLLLVGLGIVMTVIMQSSSAATATTLAALHAGTVDLTQAASMVIGQNIGTTVTAGFAAIGASVPAKRTALAHVLFNVGTGVLAFLVLPIFVGVVDWATELSGETDDAVSLAAFHTAFNILGVVIFLPFVRKFAAVIERILPERSSIFGRHLDRSVAGLGAVAVETARRASAEIGGALSRAATARLSPGPHEDDRRVEDATAALSDVRRFLASVTSSEHATTYARHVAVLHALDHLERFAQDLRDGGMIAIARDPEVGALRSLLLEIFSVAERSFAAGRIDTTESLDDLLVRLAEERTERRATTIRRAASGRLTPERVGEVLSAIRLTDRLALHVARAAHHLAENSPPVDAGVLGPSDLHADEVDGIAAQ